MAPSSLWMTSPSQAAAALKSRQRQFRHRQEKRMVIGNKTIKCRQPHLAMAKLLFLLQFKCCKKLGQENFYPRKLFSFETMSSVDFREKNRKIEYSINQQQQQPTYNFLHFKMTNKELC